MRMNGGLNWAPSELVEQINESGWQPCNFTSLQGSAVPAPSLVPFCLAGPPNLPFTTTTSPRHPVLPARQHCPSTHTPHCSISPEVACSITTTSGLGGEDWVRTLRNLHPFPSSSRTNPLELGGISTSTIPLPIQVIGHAAIAVPPTLPDNRSKSLVYSSANAFVCPPGRSLSSHSLDSPPLSTSNPSQNNKLIAREAVISFA